MLTNVFIRCKWTIARGVLQKNVLLCPQHIVQNRLWQIRGGHSGCPQIYCHRVTARSSFRFEPALITLWKNK